MVLRSDSDLGDLIGYNCTKEVGLGAKNTIPVPQEYPERLIGLVSSNGLPSNRSVGWCWNN